MEHNDCIYIYLRYVGADGNLMKKLTLTFLTLLMVMPSLVCGVSLCPMQSAQAAEVGSDAPVLCHEQPQEEIDGGVMLVQDCLGVDLQKSDTASIDKPELKTDFVVYASLIDVLNGQLTEIDSHSVRTPPLRPDIVATYLPVYQDTRRFRL